MKILIAYDGSICADAALYDLRRAGLPQVAEALIMSVADVWLPPSSDSESSESVVEESSRTHKARTHAERAVEAAYALALKAGKRVQAIFPDWDVQTEACPGSPAWEVIMKADQWKADLIVVGSHGRSAFGRFILGSVSQRIVNEARCSVRVARDHYGHENSETRIVVGIDGSPGSELAVKAMAERSWPARTEVRIIAVHNLMMSFPPDYRLPAVTSIDGAIEEEVAWLQNAVDQASKQLRAAGLTVSSLIKEGDPKYGIVEEAERWKADSIFVGARGLSRFERFLLGSVSTAIVTRAHCSVEVVRAGAQHQPVEETPV